MCSSAESAGEALVFVACGDGDGGSNNEIDVADCLIRNHIADHTVDDDGVGIKREMWPMLFPCSEGEDE